MEDRQMRWTSHQIGFFSISLIQLGCLPFCMQIVFDYGVLYNLLFFVLLNCSQFSRRVGCGGFWHHEMAARDSKSHPVLHRLLLSPFPPSFFLCVCLSVTDKSRFGPNRLRGLVLSLGHVGCQGARKCPPALRNCQWKCCHQINLSWASWDMGLSVRINTKKKYISLDWALVQVRELKVGNLTVYQNNEWAWWQIHKSKICFEIDSVLHDHYHYNCFDISHHKLFSFASCSFCIFHWFLQNPRRVILQ